MSSLRICFLNLCASLVQDAKSQKMTRSSSADDLCANKVVGNWGRLSDGGEIPMSTDETVNSKKLCCFASQKSKKDNLQG